MIAPSMRLSSEPALNAVGLCFAVVGRDILRGVTLSVRAGESIAVGGRSGSGKTTLLSVILGLVRPTAGSVKVGGADIGKSSPAQVARIRRENIGMVFQSGELLPELTPLENVMLAGLLAGEPRLEAEARAREVLGRFDVPVDGLRTASLSGGERQRVALARALVNKPALVLADEPTGSLDRATRDSVADLLFELPAAENCALVVVTHDDEVAARADRRCQLTDGVLSLSIDDVVSAGSGALRAQ
jgi:lipoprotein-releasing system ATP-binding protein